MKTLLNPWFILGCLVWLTVFVLRKLHYAIPHYSNSYLTDLFAVPVIATLGLWFMRTAIIKTNLYRLSAGQVLFIVAYLSLVFEVILPHYFSQYTADYMDVLMYVLGGLFFYKKMNKAVY